MARKYFNIVFGVSGTRTAIPDTDPGDGSVNFTDAYGPDYALDPTGGPPALLIERAKMNELFYYQTGAIQALQQWYVPDFITSADNGGSPYSYSVQQRVVLAGVVYESNVNTNTDTPPSSKWTIVPPTGSVAIPEASAGGTANAITATFSPSIGTLAQNILVAVRAAAINTSTMTFDANGLGAKAIYKGNNQAVVAGDVPGAGAWVLLQRDQTLDKWQMINPYTINVGVVGLANGGTGQITAPASFDALTVTSTNVTAAATTSIFAAAGSSLTVSGNTGITSFGANTAGQIRLVTFSGTPLITNNNTSLILPGAANRQVAAGDKALVLGLGGSNCEVFIYQANKTPPLSYVSPTQNYTADGTDYTFTHNLGIKPNMVSYVWECTSNDDTYNTGDTLVMGTDPNAFYGSLHRGYSTFTSTTTAKMQVMADGVAVARKDNSNTPQLLATGKWKVSIIAQVIS